MASIKSVYRTQVPIPPSCVAFSQADPDVFVVGTYFLEKKDRVETTAEDVDEQSNSQNRSGSLIVYKMEGDTVQELHTLPTPSAILDLVFLTQEYSSHLVTATSTGTLDFYLLALDPSSKTHRLQHLHTYQATTPTVLITDLEPHPSIPGILGYITSSGFATLLRFDPAQLLSIQPITPSFIRAKATTRCTDQGFEAWTVSFRPSPHEESSKADISIYTGSDDSTLRLLTFTDFSIRDPDNVTYTTATSSTTPDPENDDTDDDEQSLPALEGLVDRRTHTAGVVAILPLRTLSSQGIEILLTGSYDDTIRVLSHPTPTIPGMRVRASVLAELDLGGGVWRLKVMDVSTGEGTREWIVLASCMHAGSRIVRIRHSEVGEGAWEIEVLARWEENESMNYGSDSTGSTIISTSFYDRCLALWRYKM